MTHAARRRVPQHNSKAFLVAGLKRLSTLPADRPGGERMPALRTELQHSSGREVLLEVPCRFYD